MKSGIKCLVKYSQVPSAALKYIVFQHGKIGKDYSIGEDCNKEQDKIRLYAHSFPELGRSLINEHKQIPQFGLKSTEFSSFHTMDHLC